MHDDLIDAVNWAVKQGYADPKKVAIMGGSYGGYATLAGLTFTPETFACGVDIVGPSNLRTLLNAIPPYWTVGKAMFAKRMGNIDDPADAELIRSASPLFKANQINGRCSRTGCQRSRVNKAESSRSWKPSRRAVAPSPMCLQRRGPRLARTENRIESTPAPRIALAVLSGRAER